MFHNSDYNDDDRDSDDEFIKMIRMANEYDDQDLNDDDDVARKARFINLISELSERNFDRPGRLTSRTGGKIVQE